jgi:GT2 family glycosyltransferase
MNKILTVLTNWKRKDYLEDILKSFQNQTISTDIVVVDNGSEYENLKFHFENIEIIKRDNSNKCWERWIEVSNRHKKYDYICIMDDDLIFNQKDVIENCLNYMESYLECDCIGREGVKYYSQKGYVGSDHFFPNNNTDTYVDIIKGRFMFIRSKSIHISEVTPDPTCDDIVISSVLNNKIIPKFLYGSFKDLVEGNESLSKKFYQTTRREIVSKTYFG